MPGKSGTKPKQNKENKDDGESGAVVPVRLQRGSYKELMGVRGHLIAERKRNISLSESIDELIGVYYEHQKESKTTQS